jgi:hypothetical protein
MGDGLELVVDEELRAHENEPEGVDAAGEGADAPAVPGEVLLN